MIPITINKKQYKIKTVEELTTAEFIEMAKIEELDSIKYIAWQTGAKLEDVFFCKISKTVEDMIGKAPDITKMKRPKGYDYDKIVDTVGQRHQVERCRKEGAELLVYILAVSQVQSNNDYDVKKRYEEYLQRPFTEVLPAGFFFYKNLSGGRNTGIKNLVQLIPSIGIRN